MNTDLDKYKHSSYNIGFDTHVIFGADMSSSVHIDDKNRDILIFGEEPTQGFDNATLPAEAKYPMTFTNQGKNLYQVYIIIEATVSVNATKIRHFKAKDSEIKDYIHCISVIFYN